ncbi:DUF7521 family protein [Haloarcula nitratireducens]|uniref:YapH protein n=1 Tax=Haloarcula nitratireducens TaxID=2487749 RepID=A0AAW4PIX7_9EURY|nr:hypothetical protein [Halomicroarcula nitratireducens]MBX0297245.1 hypothetical protein [Halomicroarcula nitratireducens]
MALGLLLLDLFSIALISRGLTAIVGFFVASLAYRGYRRNDSAKMRALAVGIALLTTGVFVAVGLADVAGAGTGLILFVRGLVTVAGLGVVLYALVVD